MILVIDNYDSFTFNLVHELRALGETVAVHRNDTLSLSQIHEMSADAIVISPGPGHPKDAGVCCEVIRELGPMTPIFGVCLGHQAIGYTFGATIGLVNTLAHGEASRIYHDPTPLFRGVRNPFDAGRYHSLMVEEEKLPGTLMPTAFTSDGIIMAMSHRDYPIHGVQFHPESILTPEGRILLKNFVEMSQG
jgi:anthranilate synthase component II